MGAAAVDALKKLSEGGSVEANISVPVTIVTKENVDPYRTIFK
jgi:ribose transport system substrate-binding protein